MTNNLDKDAGRNNKKDNVSIEELTKLLEEPALFSKLVKEIRGATSYWCRESQTDLAQDLGVSFMTVSRIEREGLGKQGSTVLKILIRAIKQNIL